MFFFDDSKTTSIFRYKLEKIKRDDSRPCAFEWIRLIVIQKKYDTAQHRNGDKSYFVIENLDT